MLVAAKSLVNEGVTIEELAALAMRHATNIEDVIDDAIEVFKRHTDHRGGDRNELGATLHRLVPVATALVAQHFEKTLVSRAMARIDDDGAAATAGSVVVSARRLDTRVDPLSVYAAAEDHHRSVWLKPDDGLAIAAIGAVDAIEPDGEDRFSGASAARAMAARVRRHGPADAPAPILIGGFSFFTGPDRGRPAWGPEFGESRLVLPELTVIDRADGSWVQAAARVGEDGDEAAAVADLERRLDEFSADLFEPVALPAIEVEQEDADDRYIDVVRKGIDAIDAGEFEKVVLARAFAVTGDPDVASVLHELRKRSPACAVFAFSVDAATFFGATPEELVTLDGHQLHTTALAGTAPRGGTPEDDERLGQGLAASPKNQAEHRFVVEAITEALQGLGLVDPTPSEPDLLKLARVQHLRTPITARVERRTSGVSDMDVLRVAGVLHPTPAVGGTPDEAAQAFILEHEAFHRGWYAAPIGWCDLDGNGEMRVALRTALARDGEVHLFAGAGVVADSDPNEELAETSVKLRALLDVIAP